MSRLIKAFTLVAGLIAVGSTYEVKAEIAGNKGSEHIAQKSDTSVDSSVYFNATAAQNLFSYARIPIEAERRLKHEQTLETILPTLAENFPERTAYNIIRHRNSTALVLYDRDTESIYVSFDGGSERGDILDDMKFLKRHHPLGGKVHRGYYGAILKENDEGIPLIDAVRHQVESYMAETDVPKSISITGFSRGGSMAVVAAGHWFAEGFFDKGSFSLSQLYSFGNPPAGDKVFNDALSENLKNHGVDTAYIIVGRDPIPHILTETSSWYYPNRFGHVGNSFYLGIDENKKLYHVINPDKDEVKEFREKSQKMDWHEISVYTDILARYHNDAFEMKITRQPTRVPKLPHSI